MIIKDKMKEGPFRSPSTGRAERPGWSPLVREMVRAESQVSALHAKQGQCSCVSRVTSSTVARAALPPTRLFRGYRGRAMGRECTHSILPGKAGSQNLPPHQQSHLSVYLHSPYSRRDVVSQLHFIKSYIDYECFTSFH